MTLPVSGTEPGQRQLNGPQTTGRDYRNLSQPEYTATLDEDVRVPMSDGIDLLADVHRPAQPGRYPALIAASPYLRQIQNVGIPAGFVEAGASDFFVPRGYVHVIANLRGTGGSGGTFSLMDARERRDLYELVEWTAAQPWCDGNVGMVGISYFAMSQLEAAVERPPHLKAIFPVAVSSDLYEAVVHHGLASTSFVTPFIAALGMTSAHAGSPLLRSKLVSALREILLSAPVHARFARANGEAAMAGLRFVLKTHHAAHPWDDLWRAIVVEHPLRDAWWDARNLMPLLERVDIPVYLGCDWDNVPLHLPSTFPTHAALAHSPVVRVAMLGAHGLAWPWESLHVEALAWFDHWLKQRDTGILDGPPIRYVIPGGDGWHASPSWPVPGTTYRSLALRADGALAADEGSPGSRSLMTVGPGTLRTRPSESDPPVSLTWTSAPFAEACDLVGDMEIELDATSTAPDTGWIAVLQYVAPDGSTRDVTAGYMRAGLRAVDAAASREGAPVLPCRTYEAVPLGTVVRYRVPLVCNAQHVAVGGVLRLVLASDDQDPAVPALMSFRHAGVGTSSVNTVLSSSRLLLPLHPAR
ncbi:MAG: CocE/NonD family hydrolase [Proteobacteria bacterium]|nr:CocE/NonD family hydrolase [Pseudomonadota bacterium]